MSGLRTRRALGSGAQALKVVVAGPFAAGRTTLIRTISEIPVVSTERRVPDRTAALKRHATVALDFGRLTIDPGRATSGDGAGGPGGGLVLHLFGAPDRGRLDLMWEVLAEGMLGFVVLVDGRCDDAVEAAGHLRFLRETAAVPHVVAVDGVDASGDGPPVEALVRERLGGGDIRVVACDVRERESVKAVLVALLEAVLDDIDREAAGTPAP